MMLRITTTRNLRRVSNLFPPQRRNITSAQKRALQKDHISPPSASEKTAKPPTKTVSPPPPSSTSSSGSSMIPAVFGLTAVGVGVAYAMGVIPSDVLSVVPGFKKDANVEKVEVDAKTHVEKIDEKKNLSKEVEKKSSNAEVTGNRVVNIHVPSEHGRTSEPIPIPKHAEDGNRVTVKKFLQVYGEDDALISAQKVESQSTPLESETQQPAKDITTAMIMEAQRELNSSSSVQNNNVHQELAQAHTLLTTSLDEKFLKDLEGLTINDVKLRIIQLASEMNDRTKWEAVRLREFLAMKEKEISEK